MVNTSDIAMHSSDHDLNYVNNNMRMAVLPVTIIIGLENIIGLIGNILILLVYSKQYEKSNFRYFVLFMAVIDLTSCVTCVPGEVFSQLNWYKYEHAWICKVKSYFNVLGAWGSASILSLLAFDRHRKICHPLAWQLQPSLAWKLCTMAVVISTVVSAPALILWGKQTYLYEMDDIKVNVSVCEKSSEFADSIYPFLYILMVYIFPVGVMMVVVTMLNFLTAKRLFWDRDQILTEAFSVSSMRHASSSLASINTLSETLDSCPDLERTMDDGIICRQDRTQVNIPTSDIPGITRRFSAELRNYDNDGRTTSVTFITLNEGTRPSDGGNVSISVLDGAQQHSDKATRMDISKQNSSKRSLSSIRISTSTASPSSVTSNRTGARDGSDLRIKRKTIIMLVLTTMFVITMSLYVILISVIAQQNILQNLSYSEKAVYFLFLRLYFVNCAINPFLYGFIDPRFRSGIRKVFCRS